MEIHELVHLVEVCGALERHPAIEVCRHAFARRHPSDLVAVGFGRCVIVVVNDRDSRGTVIDLAGGVRIRKRLDILLDIEHGLLGFFNIVHIGGVHVVPSGQQCHIDHVGRIAGHQELA